MKKWLFVLLISIGSIFASFAVEEKSYATWSEVANEMGIILNNSYKIYASGKVKEAKDEVNVAYYQFYEKIGFERTVKAQISGNRAGVVELQFSAVKKYMTKKESNEKVKAELDKLIAMLKEDAKALDPESQTSWGTFLASLLIILREGFEAILIVGAIIAYLVKSGNKNKLAPVYWGSAVAVFASIVMAVILNALAGANGDKQEFIEGLTMLLAVAVLFYVSNWMISKAESDAWSKYIEGKVQSSVSRGSIFSLAFTAFLAVFREGAEVILFYQALLAGTKSASGLGMIWLGLGVGVVFLVFIYLAIRFLSLKLPLKPFFMATSILMFVMCISFLGNGIQEFIEGDYIVPTQIPHFPTISLLGVYPTLETFIPQVVLLFISIATVVIQLLRWKKIKQKAVSGSAKIK